MWTAFSCGDPLRGAEPHVAPHDLDAVVRPCGIAKPKSSSKFPRHSAEQRRLADAAGNGDGHHEILCSSRRAKARQKPHVFAVQLDQPSMVSAPAIDIGIGRVLGRLPRLGFLGRIGPGTAED